MQGIVGGELDSAGDEPYLGAFINAVVALLIIVKVTGGCQAAEMVVLQGLLQGHFTLGTVRTVDCLGVRCKLYELGLKGAEAGGRHHNPVVLLPAASRTG